MKKPKKATIVIILVLVLLGVLMACREDINDTEDFKPMIYLYPEQEQRVTVSLDYNGQFTHVYPRFSAEGTWQVMAKPDGTILYKNREYYGLFWEGVKDKTYRMDEGFCVRGSDTEKFLEEKLEILGLNHKEINEFIVYWLPQMEDNPYNIITFQDRSYTDDAKLTIDPKEDTMIRAFMTWYPSAKPIDIKEQTLSSMKRHGFTVVEWGGARIK
ncbi:hypothetical protein [Murdochiella massiliensis]|uniref:hypothetical protein n=1 Tax=Murdochiella massiliensis TaxID=1673723 RepID=UPI000836FEE5|nr:hypothetical protein [Murdochiella massiliensis]